MLKGTKIFRNRTKTVFKNDHILRSRRFNEGFKLHQLVQTSESFHKPQALIYPTTKPLPLPLNIEDLASSEKLKFSPQRSRDISASYISSTSPSTDVKSDSRLLLVDDRVECYDCSGAINLSSAMQTNVPFPFVSRGKPIHLNMPGGQWRLKEKYVSEDLNNVHHMNNRELNSRSGTSCNLGSKRGIKNCYICTSGSDLNIFSSPWPFISNFNRFQLREFSTMKGTSETDKKVLHQEGNKQEPPKLTPKEKLKVAVKDYGPVIVVFHVGISLVSLACCYIIVSSGVDLSKVFKSLGADEGAATASTAAEFVVAYALHKSLAPARIAMTLGGAPFIVRKLRKVGILKTPKPL